MKKLSIFVLMLLIIGQTILGPIATVSASSNENPPITNLDNEADADPGEGPGEGLGESPGEAQGEDPGEGPGEDPGEGPGEAQGEDPGEAQGEDPGENSGEDLSEDPGENPGEDLGEDSGADPPKSSDEEASRSPFSTGTAQEIEGATLTGFRMTIGGKAVGEGAFSDELEQNATANFTVEFSVPMQDDDKEAWADGSWFEFQLPKSLIDFDSAFNGGKTVNGITYSYTTNENKVRIELSGMQPDQASNTPEVLEVTFNSGFNLTSNDIEQDLVIPAATSGTETITATFTFKPSSNTEKVKKIATGTPAPGTDGNHVMDWEVWVNEAGKLLNDATLTDDVTGGHAIVAASVNVYQYTVDLNGVQNQSGSGTQVVTNGNWADINAALKDRNAYKITYKTAVNLDAEDRDGPKNFNNTVKFTNNGQPDETSSNAQHTITYGKALEKHNATGDNYTKNWRIDYNHNLLNIPQAQATLSDTISGPHEIDLSTIKVYKMNDVNGNIATNVSSGIDVTGNVTINPNTGDGKAFTINFGGAISDAYTITYQSKYNTKDFIENEDITGQTLSNTVESGSGKESTGTYSLSENLLTKGRTIDVDNKTITWTINITSDNPATSISNLTLKDTFTNGDINGEHELVDGSITITGTNGTDPTIIADTRTTTGFTISGINIAAGQTATVTYTTSFAIDDDGQVATQGYGNTATTKWTSGGTLYTKTATSEYIPEITTVNNGSKSGKFDYSTREFIWDVRVNINKRDIGGAVLVDTVGPHHEFVPGSTIEVLPLTNFGESDTGGTIGTTPIAASNYTISEESDRGFTLTFKSTSELESGINNRAYVVRYKTIDSNEIIGIGSSTETDAGNVYTNGATFKTIGDQTFTLVPASVTIDPNVANNLITKRNPSQNGTTEKITWTLDVNRSHSDLGTDVKLTDLPGDNLWLLEDSIQIATYNVTSGGVSNNNDWQTPTQRSIPVSFDTDGGFTLTFPSLENVGYQVRYETIGFGDSGDDLENTATLHYNGQTEANQKKQDKFEGKLSFSSSDSNFTSTRGSAKFKKIGIDSEKGEVKDEKLDGVVFQLVKKTTNNEYIIKTETTEDGEITFENVPYNDYLVREVAAPTEYTKMADFEFTLDATTTLDLNQNLVTVLVNTTPLPGGSCDTFTITVKDVDGELIKSGKVTLIDQNGKETELSQPLGADGKVQLPQNFPAGKYEVTHEVEGSLGEVTVKYDSNCEAPVQPALSCTVFTITIEGSNNIARPNVTVTLKHKTDNTAPVIEETTDANGKFTVPSTTQTGEYKVYEGKQYLGDVKITYKETVPTPCEAVVTEAPTCETFTLTVKDVDGTVRGAGVSITIKGKVGTTVEGVTATGTTDANGKLTTTVELPAGEYDVYEGNSATPFDEFAVNIDCAAEVQPAPSCTDFTITVKDGGGIARPNVEVTVKDQTNGTTITTVTTDSNGQIKLEPDDYLPAGTYDVYDGNFLINEITISYLNDNCESEVQGAPYCEDFKLTVLDRGGNPRNGVEITVKDANGNDVEDANGDTVITTDANGVIMFDSVIERGTYQVYEGTRLINSFTVKDDCEAEVRPRPIIPPTPAPTCDAFTVTVKQEGVEVGANVELTLKSGTTEVVGTTNANGKIVFDKTDLPEGTYTVYDEDDQAVGTVTVSYTEGECQAEIDLAPKTCDAFTLTVKQSGELVGENTEVTLKDQAGNTITTGTTDANGKIIFDKADLPEGTYTVYDKDDQAVSTITVSYTEGECQTEIDLAPITCDAFTLTVKQSGELVEENTEVTLKDQAGNTIVTGTTDANGKVVFAQADLPAGTYTASDKDGNLVGTVTVSYEEGKCQAEVDLTQSPQVCTEFTLTVQNRNSNPQVGVSVTIKDSADHVITHEGEESFVTDQNGQITIGLLTSGAYKVYVDGNLLGEITVNDTCSSIVKPRSSGGGGGGGGGTPPTKPEEPSEPDKPGETEEPENPETSEPGESETETPGPGTTDPSTPGTETPGSESPGTSTTDPGTPGAETPSVSVPGLPDAEVAGAGGGKPEAPGSGEVLAGLDEKAGNKLPQTGEAYPIGSIAGGLGAIALGAWLLFRRKREVQS